MFSPKYVVFNSLAGLTSSLRQRIYKLADAKTTNTKRCNCLTNFGYSKIHHTNSNFPLGLSEIVIAVFIVAASSSGTT